MSPKIACNTCEFMSANEHEDRLHIALYHGFSYKCNFCSKCFLDQSAVVSHLLLLHLVEEEDEPRIQHELHLQQQQQEQLQLQLQDEQELQQQQQQPSEELTPLDEKGEEVQEETILFQESLLK